MAAPLRPSQYAGAHAVRPVFPRHPGRPLPGLSPLPRARALHVQPEDGLLCALPLRGRLGGDARLEDLQLVARARPREPRPVPGRAVLDHRDGPAAPHADPQPRVARVHAEAHRRARGRGAEARRALPRGAPRREALRPPAGLFGEASDGRDQRADRHPRSGPRLVPQHGRPRARARSGHRPALDGEPRHARKVARVPARPPRRAAQASARGSDHRDRGGRVHGARRSDPPALRRRGGRLHDAPRGGRRRDHRQADREHGRLPVSPPGPAALGVRRTRRRGFRAGSRKCCATTRRASSRDGSRRAT